MYGSIKFGLYNTTTKELALKYQYRQESGLAKIGCGVFAGDYPIYHHPGYVTV